MRRGSADLGKKAIPRVLRAMGRAPARSIHAPRWRGKESLRGSRTKTPAGWRISDGSRGQTRHPASIRGLDSLPGCGPTAWYERMDVKVDGEGWRVSVYSDDATLADAI